MLTQGIHTSAYPLPQRPLAVSTYWHRPIDVQKLLSCNFCTLPAFTSTLEFFCHYDISSLKETKGLREMKRSDVPAVHKLLFNYLSQFKVSTVFSRNEYLPIYVT